MVNTTERDHITDTTVFNKKERGHYGSLQAGISDIHRPIENVNILNATVTEQVLLVVKSIKKNESVFNV